MPKNDDKHSLAEDYLAQIKWRGEHPYRKGATPIEPDWKYQPVYARLTRASHPPNALAIILLLALLGVLGFAIFQMITISRTSLAFPLIALILLALFLIVTREPKRPTTDD